MTRAHLARLVATLAIPVLAAACTSAAATPIPTIPSEPPATPTPAATHPGPTYPPGCPTTQPAALAASDTRTVTIETAKGKIVIAIKGSLSPIATGNFVALVSCGYYDGVVFHRAAPGFVIQGGDGQFGRSPDVIPDLVGAGGPPYTIKDEPVTVPYTRGTVAMAKTSDPDSATSQFFIVLADIPAGGLDPRYQVLGTVTSGMDVVDAIASLPATGQKLNDPVVMTKVTVANP